MATFHTKRDLAASFGCSYTTVIAWCGRADFPGGKAGPWERRKVARYLESIRSPYAPSRRKLKSRTRVSTYDGPSRLKADAEALKIQEQHRRLKLQNDQLEQLLVYAERVTQQWNVGMNRIRTRLEALPEEIENLLPNEMRRDVKQDIEAFVKQLLNEMANWEPLGL